MSSGYDNLVLYEEDRNTQTALEKIWKNPLAYHTLLNVHKQPVINVQITA